MEFINATFQLKLCIFVVLFFLQNSYGNQIHGAAGSAPLKCYDCWYIKEQPLNTNEGFNKSCLQPSKEKARNRECYADEKSCSKLYIRLDFGNGINMTYMARNCTEKQYNRDFEPCSPVNSQTYIVNSERKLSLTLALAMERLWEAAAAANILETLAGRKQHNATVLEGRECLCDKREYCNSDPGMEAHDNSGLKCYMCSYTPDAPEYSVGRYTTKCLDPDKDGAPSIPCAPAFKSCLKLFKTIKYDDDGIYHVMSRKCNLRDLAQDTCRRFCGKYEDEQGVVNTTAHGNSAADVLAAGNTKVAPGVSAGAGAAQPTAAEVERMKHIEESEGVEIMGLKTGRSEIKFSTSSFGCTCNSGDNCNNRPGAEVIDDTPTTTNSPPPIADSAPPNKAPPTLRPSLFFIRRATYFLIVSARSQIRWWVYEKQATSSLTSLMDDPYKQ